MSGVLIVAEHRQGALREVTLELIAAAKELKNAGVGPLAVAMLGSDVSAMLGVVALDGVDEIIHVPVAMDEFNGEVYRQALPALIRQRRPLVLLTGFTVDAMSYAPALDASLGLGFASDVTGCSAQKGWLTATRGLYAGKVQVQLDFGDGAPVLLMLRPGAWSPAGGFGSPVVTRLEAGVDLSQVRIKHREYITPQTEGIDLGTSDFILAIGRGVGEKDNVPVFERLADRLGATLACSRPLVDSGWLPHARQVGQSGATVKPELYLALGISGAVEHLAGMKASGTIIAVNSDPEAAIFNVAHYGAVTDLFALAEALEQLT